MVMQLDSYISNHILFECIRNAFYLKIYKHLY